MDKASVSGVPAGVRRYYRRTAARRRKDFPDPAADRRHDRVRRDTRRGADPVSIAGSDGSAATARGNFLRTRCDSGIRYGAAGHVTLANLARRYGIVSLDAELGTIQDPFMKKVLILAVDGTEPQELRKIVELELDN